MAIVFDSDAGTITGLSVGGLPDGVVDADTLASDAVTAAKIPDTVEAGFKSGRKNMIINGAMQVAQRGTSSTSDGYATVDRFFTYKESCEQLAVTQTQSSTSPDGFASSYKLDVTTAESAIEANDQYEIVTRFEGQDLQHLQHNSSGAKSVTLSFWVRSSKTGTYCVALYKRDTTRNITSTYTISSVNTWEKKTVTFVGDTSGAIDNDNARSLDISWKLLIGSNFTGTASTTWGSTTDARSADGHTATWGSSTSDDFYLTGVQLELGSTATDFEHRSYGEELALCQRYYQAVEGAGGAYEWDGLYANGAGAGLGINFPFPVEMRASPTLTVLFNDLNNIQTQQNSATKQGIFVGAQTTSDGRTAMKKNSSGYVRLNAEL